jgi:hypothetical protein
LQRRYEVLWYQQSLAAYLESASASGAIAPSAVVATPSSVASLSDPAALAFAATAASLLSPLIPAASFEAVLTSPSSSSVASSSMTAPVLPGVVGRALAPVTGVTGQVKVVAVAAALLQRPPRPSSAPPPSSADRQFWLDSRGEIHQSLFRLTESFLECWLSLEVTSY